MADNTFLYFQSDGTPVKQQFGQWKGDLPHGMRASEPVFNVNGKPVLASKMDATIISFHMGTNSFDAGRYAGAHNEFIRNGRTSKQYPNTGQEPKSLPGSGSQHAYNTVNLGGPTVTANVQVGREVHGLGGAVKRFAGKIPMLGGLLVGGIAMARGASAAEAAQEGASAVPVARIAAAPNTTERSLRALGDSGLATAPVLGPLASLAYTGTQIAEEGVRTINDAAGVVGAGNKNMDPGLIKSGVELGATVAEAGYRAGRQALGYKPYSSILDGQEPPKQPAVCTVQWPQASGIQAPDSQQPKQGPSLGAPSV